MHTKILTNKWPQKKLVNRKSINKTGTNYDAFNV